MMSLTKSDFSKICRICLKEQENLTSILNSEILNMFHTCTKIKIENNKFPENICPSCLDKLNTAYTFHQQCERSDNILHQIIEYDDKSRFLAISNVQENQMFIENDTNDFHESKEMIFEEKNILVDSDGKFSHLDKLVHSNRRSLTCQICFKTYSRSDNLRTHQRRIHKMQFTKHTKNSEENQIENDTDDFHESKEIVFEEIKILDNLNGLRNINDTKPETRDSLQEPKLENMNDCQKSPYQYETNNEEFSYLDKLVEHTETNHKVVPAHLQNHDQLICHDCGKTFVHMRGLKKHIQTHSIVRSLTCTICFKTYSRSDNLKTHQRRVHKMEIVEHTKNSEDNQIENETNDFHESKDMIFEENNDSDEKFSPLDKLVHSNSGSLTCTICFKTYSRSDNLRTHQRKVHKIQISKHARNSKKNQIENETNDLHESKEMIFEEKNILNDSHENYKSDTENGRKSDTLQECKVEKNDCQKSPYRCETSNEELLHVDKLVKHTETNHKVKPVGMQNDKQMNCRYCDKTFMGMRELTKHHSQVHSNDRSYICTECSRTFSTLHSLKAHLKYVHQIFWHWENQVKLNRQKCNICQKEVLNLKAHKEVHLTGDNFQCEKCSKYFATEARLKRHTIYTHDKRYVKPVLCNVCGIQTAHNGFLNRHMRIHTGEKPFKCDMCDKSFRHKSGLVAHKITHSDEKSFICNICSKGFKSNIYLKEHMFLHTGKRPHVCHICSKSFTYRKHLRRHLKIH